MRTIYVDLGELDQSGALGLFSSKVRILPAGAVIRTEQAEIRAEVPRYQEITGKDFYFILTAADTQQENLERTMGGFRGFTEECLEGAVEKGVLYATGVWNKGEVDTTSFMEQAYQMGHSV